MKPVRFIVGAISFLFVWFFAAIVIGTGMAMLFPPPDGRFMAGVGLDWRNLPGTILGLLAGGQSFRTSVRGPKKKDDKP